MEGLVLLTADLDCDLIIATTFREALAKRGARELGLALIEGETHDWQLAVSGCPLVLVFTVRPREMEGATQVFPIEVLPKL